MASPELRYAILIPARLGSTRLPEKVLLAESGKFLVQHVQERALEAPGEPRVVVLTDDARVEAAVRSYGGEVMRTRADHRSGTDRCAEAAERLPVEVCVNLQADEPLISPRDLYAAALAASEPGVDIATLGTPFSGPAQLEDESAVKALVRPDGTARDFQRTAPTAAQEVGVRVLHHLGVYAFTRERLLAFPGLVPTERERERRLEQLRALDHGWTIRVLEAERPALGIDTREDYEAFLRTLRGEGPA